MWYVAQTLTGHEEAAREAVVQAVELERRIHEGAQDGAEKPVLETCFVPRYSTVRKREGEWVPVTEPLFPGYLIVVTDRVEDLATCLRRHLRSTRIIGKRSRAFIPLEADEIVWIDAFTHTGTDVIEISTGIVSKGDVVEVVEGPLVGHEGWIKDINHRKKVAYLEMEAFGRKIQAEVGLRVTRRRGKGSRENEVR